MGQRGDAFRDMLFVLLGLRAGVLDKDALLGAFGEWDCAGGRSLVEELVRRGVIAEGRLAEIERLVAEYLRCVGGESQADLSTVGSMSLVREGGTVGLRPELGATLLDSGPTLADFGNGGAPRAAGRAEAGPGPEGRFRVVRFHAEGGLGIVSLAVDTELNREVALKEIKPRYADDPTSQSRFLLEAEVTGGLEHPGIVPVYGLGIDAFNRPYYAMRFIRGESLEHVIARFHADEKLKHDPGARGLELRKLLRRFLDVCNTIEYAHGRKVLHRDIKPANIMVGPHGETLVVDWGIAKAMGCPDQVDPGPDGEKPLNPKSGSGSTETLPGSALGTPAFMSVEQYQGDLARIGPASDVYSLGATLYNLLTGMPPFDKGDVLSVLHRVERGDFPPPRERDRTVHPALEAVCLKAMRLDPADRYPSARALADDLERWMADEPVSAYPDPLTDRARRWMRRRKTGVTAAAAAALVAVAGLVVVLVVQHRANRELSLANEREHERFGLAMDAIRTFHTGVSEDFLLKQKEFKDLRDKLLLQAKGFYHKLEEKLKGQDDPASRAALGSALFELGELTSNVGLKPDALAAHREGLAIRRGLVSGAGVEAGVGPKVDVGRSLTAIAEVERATGMQADAERDYEEALAVLTPPARANPADPQALAALAVLQRRYGQFLATTRRSVRARALYDEARGLWDRVLRARPGDVEASRELAWTHHYVGDLLARQDSPDDALAAYEAARDIRRRIADANPGLLQARFDLASSENTIGRLLSGNARPAEALDAFRSGLSTRLELAKTFAAVLAFQDAVARSYHNIAMLLARTGETEDAVEAFRQALKIRRVLTRDNPAVPLYRIELAATLSDLAGKLYRVGRIDEAVAAFTESRSIEEAVLEEHPGIPDYVRNLALSHMSFGTIVADTGSPSEALTCFEKARDLLKSLADADRTDQKSAVELVMAYRQIGEHLAANGDPEGALENLARARSLLNPVLSSGTTETFPKLNQALCDLETGKLHTRKGAFDRAREDLGSARVTLRALLDSERSETAYRQALALAEDAACALESRAGRVREALAANGRARDTWDALAKADPTNFEYQGGRAQNLLELGECLARSGDPAKARDAFERARGVAENLAGSNPRFRRFQVQLAAAERALGGALGEGGDAPGAVAALRRALRGLDARPDCGPAEFALKAAVLALLHGLHADPDDGARAVAALRTAFEAGYRDFPSIRADRGFDPVRDSGAFLRLLDEFGFPPLPFAAPGR